MNSKVSVIIPTYNRSALLAEAVRSVIAQTWRNWEIIVIDDGSTDNTKAVVDGFQNAWIKYVYVDRAEGGNPGRTRNRGIDLADGEYIAFLDSDDVWAPGKLEQQLKAFEQDPRVGLSVTNFRFVDGQGAVTQDAVIPPGYIYRGAFAKDYLEGDLPVYTSTVMARRSAFANVRFNPKYVIAEDMDVWIKLSRLVRVAYAPEPLTSIRKHGDNLSSRRAETLLSAGPVLEENFENLQAQGLNARKYAARFYCLAADAAVKSGQKKQAMDTLGKALAAYPWDLNIYKGFIKCATAA